MPHPRAQLTKLYQAQSGLCGICGEPMGEDMAALHVDHIVPRSRGGSDLIGNLQAAHKKCNMTKKDKMPPVGEGLVADLVERCGPARRLVRLSATVPAEQIEWLEERSTVDFCNVSVVIRQLIAKEMEREEQERAQDG